MISTETPVGQLASEHPLATRAFARHGIDFCCGGKKTLAQACAEKGIDPHVVLTDVSEVLAEEDEEAVTWSQRPTAELIDHLVETYHARLREELPRLEAMLRKVVRVHGDKSPERFSELLETYLALKAELEPHLLKEEQILFPMILHGQGAQAGGPIAVLQHEHEDAGAVLKRIRELTDDFVAPPEACATWTALWAGLAAFETELHEHIHLENNVLFLRDFGPASA